MKKLGNSILTWIILITLIVTSYGCAWPFYNNQQNTESGSNSSNWFYTGESTGVDPRAKEIERRLGYE